MNDLVESSITRLALAQLTPEQNSVEANVSRVVEVIAEYADRDLVIFPELFLSGISREGYEQLQVEVGGPELTRIADAARDSGSRVVVGAALRGWRGTVNAALAYGADGELTGVYEKTHPWDRERNLIAAGEEIAPTAVGELRAGLMVCFDLEFPEVARTLALQRPQLLITIAANMEPFGPDHALMARARAVENRLPHVYVNRSGSACGSEFVGESVVVTASGEVLAEAGRDATVLEVEVEIDGEVDPRVDYLHQRRPDLYRPMAETPAG